MSSKAKAGAGDRPAKPALNASKAAPTKPAAAKPAPAKKQEATPKAAGGDGAHAGKKRQRVEISGGSDHVAPAAKLQTSVAPASGGYTNRQRVLIFGSRGMTARYRHLMEDIKSLIPHHKKESKLDAADNLAVVNEIAASKSCQTTLFFEVRKKRDLYLWLSHTPSGPSIKFHVVNVHTMDELRLTGNCLKNSRPILSFDRAFDDEASNPHLRLVRELLATAFAVPKGHPKSQPFHDHVLHFGFADGKVWLRNYQIVDKTLDGKEAAKLLEMGEQPTVLVEIGPRFVLDIIRVFGGSMGGPTLWENPEYVSPNLARRQITLAKADKYSARMAADHERKARAVELVEPVNPVDQIFRDDADDLEDESDE